MQIFVKEKEIEKVVLENLLVIKKAEEEICETIKKQVENNLSRSLLYVNQQLKMDDTYRELDNLYDFILAAVDLHKKYLSIIEENKESINNKKIKDIIVGVGEVLSSNLSDLPNDDDNPISYERQLVISTTILKIKEYIINELDSECNNYKIPRICTRTSVVDSVNEFVIELFDNSYDDIINIIINRTRDLNLREEAKRYIGYVSSIIERLENIIVLQVDIVEKKNNEDGLELITDILNVLKELYQKCLTEEEKVKQIMLDSKKSNTNIISRDKIKEILESNVLIASNKLDSVIDVIELNKSSILDMLIKHMTDELQKCINFTLKEIKKESSKFQLLSCITLEIIDDSLNKLIKLPEMALRKDESNKIVEGIRDSICLKAESLREKDTSYQMKKKEDNIYFEKQLLDFKNEFVQRAEVYLDEAIQGSNEGFLLAQEKYNKLVIKIKEENLKRDIKYLKNDLLFEIITLEEVVKFSLPKLEEEEGENVKSFIDYLYQTYERICMLLEKNKIHEINPMPHDKFNGLEHEVIIVEEEEGFNKGEIIRVNTKGYKYNDIIIVRANIIAAK